MIPTQDTKKLSAREDGLTFAAPAAQAVNGSHPLEARIRGWEDAQTDMRMESYRRNFGAAEPIRRSMELQIADRGIPGMSAMHSDILRNKDMHIDWEDVYGDERPHDVHTQLSATVHMRDL